MRKSRSILAVACALLISGAGANAQMTLLSHFSANQPGGSSAGEIVAFDTNTNRLFVTSSGSPVHRINIFDITDPSLPAATGTPIDFSSTFGLPSDMLGLSSVAVDPMGRFGVAALIPANNSTSVGKIGYFNLATGAIIGTADVGYHPDSVSFSADGSRLVVVNEGEFNPASGTNAPGSISVIDVSGINGGNLATLPSLAATTADFSAANLGPGVSLSGIRNSNIAGVGVAGNFINSVPDFTQPANIDFNAIEPEYATIAGSKVYVSLQDNNALGEFDLTTGKWTSVKSLGTITQLVDASDQDGGININDSVKGLPMPDTVASYTVQGKTYVVTANEGDARVDDRDVSRFGDTSGSDDMDAILDNNYPGTATGVRANAELGRLTVSRIDGDTDADNLIDDIHMLGTRSLSIWEQTSGGPVLTSDTGSFFEEFIRDNDAAGWQDGRSDDKGPEPEGLTLGVINGKTYAFIGMERTDSIFMFNITDPANPLFVDYFRIVDGANTPKRPEGFLFVPASESPNGQNLLVVGFEGDGGILTERIAIFSVVPEPTGVALAVSGVIVGVGFHRRRRRADK